MMMLYHTLVLCVGLVQATPSAWWRDAVYYRLQVDSFKDTDGDGLGDIKGVTKQLSYVRALGADALVLSALSARSDDCSRPGTLHHTDIDHRYGTLDDFRELLEKANKLEIKVMLELPMQTVSMASEWFADSRFEQFVLWRAKEPIERTPRVDAWLPNDNGTCYYAVRDKEAVVDLCQEGVKAAFTAMVCAWLRRGVAGVLLQPDFEIDDVCAGNMVRHLTAAGVECARTASLDAPVVLVGSALEPKNASRYYADGAGAGANSVLSDALAMRLDAAEMALRVLADTLLAPYGLRPAWVSSQLETGRIATRLGSNLVDAINLLTLILPGAAVIQQGDELGAADGLLELMEPSEKCWPSRPFSALAPFPWDDSASAGFSAGEPWMPVTPNYRYANAKSQFSSESSHAGVVRVAAAMRKSPAFGPHAEITRLEDAIAVLRWGDSGSLLLVANLGEHATEAQPSRIAGIASEMSVATSSAGSKYAVGTHIFSEHALRLGPGECVLLAGAPRHCGGPGPVDKIATKLAEGWQKINKYFGTM